MEKSELGGAALIAAGVVERSLRAGLTAQLEQLGAREVAERVAELVGSGDATVAPEATEGAKEGPKRRRARIAAEQAAQEQTELDLQ